MNRITRIMYWSILKVFGRLNYRDNGMWVFGEWFGKKCCDNCMYFANYVAKNHPQIKCVWISKKEADLSELDKKIDWVEMDTPQANDVLCNASVVFMNQGIPDVTSNPNYIISGPLTINLWHGVPWKKIGLDGEQNTNAIKRLYYKVQVKLLAAEYYLSLSDQFSKILISACGANKNRIIKAGYPRNEIFYDQQLIEKQKKRIVERYSLNNIVGNNPIIIAYMPTFRDKAIDSFSFVSIIDNPKFMSILEKYNVVIIEKSHFAVKSENVSNSSRLVLDNDVIPQNLLAAADILITDYSSCSFDYLILDRPIIYYLYDIDYYTTKDRGLYYDKVEVACGDTPVTTDELILAIEENILNRNRYHELRTVMKNRFISYESKDSNDIIFNCLIDKLKIKN